MIVSPNQILPEARASDHAISAYIITTAAELAQVLAAPKHQPTVLHVPRQLVAAAALSAGAATFPVVLHVDHPASWAVALEALEAGATSFEVAADDTEIMQELIQRGVWLEVELPSAAALPGAALPAGINAVSMQPPRTIGAFTGREYILFDTLERQLAAVPPALSVTVRDLTRVAPAHRQLVASLPISKIVYEVSPTYGTL